jgi:hypothetical protein
LLLSLKTGLVSPQFHVRYDDTFETVRSLREHEIPPSLWQAKAGFEGTLASKDTNPKGDVSPTGEVLGTELGIIPVTENHEDQALPAGELQPDMREPPLREPPLREPPLREHALKDHDPRETVLREPIPQLMDPFLYKPDPGE